MPPADPSIRRVPAIEGWFSVDPEPHLLGKRCSACGTYAFPPTVSHCPNPDCGGGEVQDVPLSRRGRVWSTTINHYAPPPPYISPEPFQPFGVAAVELSEERMIVLGQVAGDSRDLSIGDEVELVVDGLFEDDDGEHVVWKWRGV